MNANRYAKLWFPVIGLHALHQVEESISFFGWYIDKYSSIPEWLRILSLDNAQLSTSHPSYFVLASIAQVSAISLIAFLFRKNEKITRVILILYILGLTYFLVWHILISYFTHSYSPIMLTSIGGIYLIPFWLHRIYKLSKRSEKTAIQDE